MLTQQQEGICALIYTTCCTNVNKSGQIEHDVCAIYKHYTKSQYLLVDFHFLICLVRYHP